MSTGFGVCVRVCRCAHTDMRSVWITSILLTCACVHVLCVSAYRPCKHAIYPSMVFLPIVFTCVGVCMQH